MSMALGKRCMGIGMRDFGWVTIHGEPYGMCVYVQLEIKEHVPQKNYVILFQFQRQGIQRVFFNREKQFPLPFLLVIVLSCHVGQIVKLHTRSTEIPIQPFLFKQSCHWFQWQLCLIKENWIGPWSNGVLSLSLLFWPLTITLKSLKQ